MIEIILDRRSLIVVFAAWATCAAAPAYALDVTTTITSEGFPDVIEVTDPGAEPNDVTLRYTHATSTLVLEDQSASFSLVDASTCDVTSAGSRLTCTVGYGGVSVDLGDGEDRIDLAQDGRGIVCRIALGAGRDTVVDRVAEASGGSIFAPPGCDDIDAGPGEDVITVSQVLARIAGGDGDDTLTGIRLEGGSGDDTLTCVEHPSGCTASGGPDDDHVTGTAGDDGLGGGPGDDVLLAGDGADHVADGSGTDLVRAGGGDDTVVDGPGVDDHDGGPGTDSLSYSERPAAVDVDLAAGHGGSAAEPDRAVAFENATGGLGNDRLRGTDGPSYLYGGPGDDHLDGRGGADRLLGVNGADVLVGGPGDDELSPNGGPGLSDPDGYDQVDGGPGRDTLFMQGPAPVIVDLVGDTGSDLVRDVEVVWGSDGPDVLIGGDDDNRMIGLGGADTIDVRGAGADEADCGGSDGDRAFVDVGDLVFNCPLVEGSTTAPDPPAPPAGTGTQLPTPPSAGPGLAGPAPGGPVSGGSVTGPAVRANSAWLRSALRSAPASARRLRRGARPALVAFAPAATGVLTLRLRSGPTTLAHTTRAVRAERGVRLRPALTAAGRRALRRRARITTRLRVTFTPSGGGPSVVVTRG